MLLANDRFIWGNIDRQQQHNAIQVRRALESIYLVRIGKEKALRIASVWELWICTSLEKEMAQLNMILLNCVLSRG